MKSELTLIDEAGAPRQFTVHDAVDMDGHTYYLVEALDEDQVLVLIEREGNLEAVEGEELERVLEELDEPHTGE
jgi:hypothetical protein